VAGDRHDRAGAVLHQHVVGDVHRDLLPVDRVDDLAAERHAGFRAVLVAAIRRGLAHRLVDVFVNGARGVGAGNELVDQRVLGGEDEESGAEQGVGAGREHGEIEVELLAAEYDLGPLGAADPVALHGDHVLGPVLEQVEVGEQALGVVRDLEEPLLELALLDQIAAALAAAVDHLLVGEHGLVEGAPLDRGLGAVGEPALEQLEEDPLGPAVVLGLVGADLARPVDRDSPLHELLAERVDRLLGRDPRVLAGLDRVVLGRQPEGVVAHRMHDLKPVAALEVRDRVADRVALEMPDVRLPRGVRKHLEHIALRLRLVVTGFAGAGDLSGLLSGPNGLPLAFYIARRVAAHGAESRCADSSRTRVAASSADFAGVAGFLGDDRQRVDERGPLGGLHAAERPAQRRQRFVDHGAHHFGVLLGDADDRPAAVGVVLAALDQAGAAELADEEACRAQGQAEPPGEVTDAQWTLGRQHEQWVDVALAELAALERLLHRFRLASLLAALFEASDHRSEQRQDLARLHFGGVLGTRGCLRLRGHRSLSL
jgi:hypothetical protein